MLLLAASMSYGQNKLDSIQRLQEVTITSKGGEYKEVIPSQKLSGKEL